MIRDEHGEVIAALAGKIPIPDSVLTLKLWRLGKRFNLFKNLAFVIPSLRATPHLPLMLLVMDNYYICLEVILLKTFYCFLAFSHICRQCNALTNTFAKRAKFSFPLFV